MTQLADMLRPHVEAIKADAQAGDRGAKQVISLYALHVSAPADHVAVALCEAAFEDWLANRSGDRAA